MVKIIVKITFLIFIFCLIIACDNQNSGNLTEKTPKTVKDLSPSEEKTPDLNKWENTIAKQTLKISEMRGENPGAGIYQFDAYVIDNSYSCPCLEEGYSSLIMYCSCEPPNIVVAENKQSYEWNKLKDNEIKIFVNTPKDFKKDQKYSFKIKIEDHQSDSDSVSEVQLVAYRGMNEPLAQKPFTIKDIKSGKVKSGTFYIQGFVTKIYQCPPCPPQSKCAPCRRPNSIVVAEKQGTSADNEPNENEIILRTKKPGSFEKGKKYNFEIKLENEKLPNDPDFRIIDLINHREMEN